ncbi:MAG: methyltransferase domain-containing protein [Leptospirales bacterium]
MKKSTIAEIEQRFNNDVDRFSDLETGQTSTIDATISLDLITEAARRMKPDAKALLDVGCGAGNYTLQMLSKLPDLRCTLIDLSKPMLDKAFQRVTAKTNAEVSILHGDIRVLELENNSVDIILAGAVLHHLRDDSDWEFTFQKLFNLLKPDGCLMISDLIIQETKVLTYLIWEKYSIYLKETGGTDYRDKVFKYIDQEDSPRSMTYQLDLMRKVGFDKVEILHKNTCFGAFAGIK